MHTPVGIVANHNYFFNLSTFKGDIWSLLTLIVATNSVNSSLQNIESVLIKPNRKTILDIIFFFLLDPLGIN